MKKVERVRGVSYKGILKMSVDKVNTFMQPKRPHTFGEMLILKKWFVNMGILNKDGTLIGRKNKDN